MMRMRYEHKIRLIDLESYTTSDFWELRSQMASWRYANLGTQGWLHDPDSFELEHAHDLSAFILAWSA
jgi:hypothetical protein